MLNVWWGYNLLILCTRSVHHDIREYLYKHLYIMKRNRSVHFLAQIKSNDNIHCTGTIQ